MARKIRRKRKSVEAEQSAGLVNVFAARHATYREATVVDLGNELGGGRQKTYRVIRNLTPTVADHWMTEGGPGFEAPQRRAIEHCRALWHRLGSSGTLVANLNWIGGGHAGREK